MSVHAGPGIPGRSTGPGHLPLWMELGIEAGLGVAALWAVLALGGVWRATPEGPDRLGRAVGIAWLVYVASGDLLIYLMPFSWV